MALLEVRYIVNPWWQRQGVGTAPSHLDVRRTIEYRRCDWHCEWRLNVHGEVVAYQDEDLPF